MSPDWFVSFLLIVAYSASTGKQLHGMLKLRVQEAHMACLKRRCGNTLSKVTPVGQIKDEQDSEQDAAE